MISSSAVSLGLSGLNSKYTPPIAGPTPEPNNTTNRTPEAERRKLNKGSSQLIRWSRARAIRSGVKLDRSVQRTLLQNSEVVDRPVRPSGETESSTDSPLHSSEEEDGCLTEMDAGAKHIYMVSDGTGWTAEHSVNAALGQFEHCLVDRGCPVNTHLFSGIDDVERLIEIIKQAAREGAMLIYTLADENMAASARHACKRWGVPSTDLLSPITEAIALHLGVSPSGLPRGAPGRKFPLTQDYFKRIDAIEFTIKQDDGALPQNLHKADIVLAGVSRTGKTPLSIYLAQKGFKVANVPIVMGVDLPNTLFKIDQEKIFALTINPVVLQTIRRARSKTLGFSEQVRTNYSEMDHVREELDFACKIFAQNPTWPVIEVTGKAIEETAVTVLRLYQDRKNSLRFRKSFAYIQVLKPWDMDMLENVEIVGWAGNNVIPTFYNWPGNWEGWVKNDCCNLGYKVWVGTGLLWVMKWKLDINLMWSMYWIKFSRVLQCGPRLLQLDMGFTSVYGTAYGALKFTLGLRSISGPVTAQPACREGDTGRDAFRPVWAMLEGLVWDVDFVLELQWWQLFWRHVGLDCPTIIWPNVWKAFQVIFDVRLYVGVTTPSGQHDIWHVWPAVHMEQPQKRCFCVAWHVDILWSEDLLAAIFNLLHCGQLWVNILAVVGWDNGDKPGSGGCVTVFGSILKVNTVLGNRINAG
ncbi:hypothetical protein E3N88_37219 [Mikania micrantha]|uniref:Pyruvate, phosphate dikinase regulatory protein, chloroplastic n=1 Tax=Mikania micrantha TaxID=192012 RepID=A0A5N6M5Y4_9ASTR|nr:hypothetical protein E3N88_37219 [Mikania micrantha]